jgi:hypothetical protein
VPQIPVDETDIPVRSLARAAQGTLLIITTLSLDRRSAGPQRTNAISTMTHMDVGYTVARNYCFGKLLEAPTPGKGEGTQAKEGLRFTAAKKYGVNVVASTGATGRLTHTRPGWALKKEGERDSNYTTERIIGLRNGNDTRRIVKWLGNGGHPMLTVTQKP